MIPGSMLDTSRVGRIVDAIREADAMGLPGVVAEFGCCLGGTARAMSQASPTRRLFVFDTFSGLTPPDPAVDAALTQGQFAAPLAYAAPILHDLPVTIVVGAFPESAHGLSPTICVAHLDFDLYHPTVAALRYVWDRMPPGGTILLDDYTNGETPGIKQAIHEFGQPFDLMGMQARIRR